LIKKEALVSVLKKGRSNEENNWLFENGRRHEAQSGLERWVGRDEHVC
jgi:hypothetical protein